MYPFPREKEPLSVAAATLLLKGTLRDDPNATAAKEAKLKVAFPCGKENWLQASLRHCGFHHVFISVSTKRKSGAPGLHNMYFRNRCSKLSNTTAQSQFISKIKPGNNAAKNIDIPSFIACFSSFGHLDAVKSYRVSRLSYVWGGHCCKS